MVQAEGKLNQKLLAGDITQIDLPTGTRSGLKEAQQILRDIDGIKFAFFSEKDVVRHRLVQDIITAYERAQAERERLEEEKREQRRLQRQARYDDRYFRQNHSRSEPENTAAMDPNNLTTPEPRTSGAQSSTSDGPGDSRPESSISEERQTD